MNIDLRKDAPAQSDIINPEELSIEIEKLQSIHGHLEQKDKEIKRLNKIVDMLEQRIAKLEKVLASHAKCIGELREDNNGS